MKRQVRVSYAGRVQGVGFRLTAEETAQRMGVVGWVKNMRDGKVEITAEAEKATLERFLDAVRNGPMKNFIRREDVCWAEASGLFDSFDIQY